MELANLGNSTVKTGCLHDLFCKLSQDFLQGPLRVFDQTHMGVYKHWTGLLEWWNSGMVDWIVFFLFHYFIML